MEAARVAGAKIFLGCPMYDGRCHAQFAFPLCQLSAACTSLGIPLEIQFASGEPLVMRARNWIADMFLESDCTHLMMIDSDIGFDARDVLTLLELQCSAGGDNEYDVLSAPYPLKRLAWDKVARAAKLGLAESNPTDLQHFASDVLICSARSGEFEISRPVEVTQAGTGFMMIRRRTLELFQARYPEKRCKADGALASGGQAEATTLFFDTGLDGEAAPLDGELRAFMKEHPAADREAILAFLSARHERVQTFVSEDFMFCRLVRGMGLKLWTCPWMTLSHIGSHEFTSRLADLARLERP